MKRYYGLLTALVLIALVWLAVLGVLRTGEAELHGDEFRRPAFDFSLTDHKNRKFTLSDHPGKVILLNFGFTNCPDICPTTLGNARRGARYSGRRPGPGAFHNR